jgi:hypothetical protein
LRLTIAGLRKPSPYGVERVMGKTKKLIKKELKAKADALRKKAEEFKKQGDLTRAENCLFLAKYLEDFLASEV